MYKNYTFKSEFKMCTIECDKCYDSAIEIKSDWGIRKRFVEK